MHTDMYNSVCVCVCVCFSQTDMYDNCTSAATNCLPARKAKSSASLSSRGDLFIISCVLSSVCDPQRPTCQTLSLQACFGGVLSSFAPQVV